MKFQKGDVVYLGTVLTMSGVAHPAVHPGTIAAVVPRREGGHRYHVHIPDLMKAEGGVRSSYACPEEALFSCALEALAAAMRDAIAANQPKAEAARG